MGMVLHKTLFVADEGSIASLVQLWSVVTCMVHIFYHNILGRYPYQVTLTRS